MTRLAMGDSIRRYRDLMLWVGLALVAWYIMIKSGPSIDLRPHAPMALVPIATFSLIPLLLYDVFVRTRWASLLGGPALLASMDLALNYLYTHEFDSLVEPIAALWGALSLEALLIIFLDRLMHSFDLPRQ